MQYVPARMPVEDDGGKLVERLQRQLLTGGGHLFLQRLDGRGRRAARPLPGELGRPVAVRGPQSGVEQALPAGQEQRRRERKLLLLRIARPGIRWSRPPPPCSPRRPTQSASG